MIGARIALAAALGLFALPALAQPAAGHAACPAIDDAAIPAHLSAWTARTPLAAAKDAAGLPAASLPVGKGVDAQLARNGEVAFPVLPAKPGGSVSHGGLFELKVAEAGDHQISLGSGAWIEVIDGKTVLEPVSHAPGPACTSLRKTVVYPLKPGRYLLEITGNGDAVLPLMVTRLVK